MVGVVRSSRVRPVVRAVALVVSLAVALAGCGSSGHDAPQKSRGGAEYVALGDSYTAGAGMQPVVDRPCGRSSVNYPSLVAAALEIKDFADRSCGGARTLNLQQAQRYRYFQLNGPQLDALGSRTRLVTIGMGLNDDAISTGLLLICLTPSTPQPSQACLQYLQLPDSTIQAEIRSAAGDLAAAIALIRRKAPRAKVVVVGYPRIAPDQGTCGAPGEADAPFPVPAAQVARLRETMAFVDRVWHQTADETGSLYVDMYSASEGHDICSADPWISGYRGVAGQAAALHPFPAYAKAVAEQVVHVLGR